MTDIAARLRIIDELDAEARRAWGAAMDRLEPDEYRNALLALALDRIAACEPRGYARRRPAQPATLDATRLAPGLE